MDYNAIQLLFAASGGIFFCYQVIMYVTERFKASIDNDDIRTRTDNINTVFKQLLEDHASTCEECNQDNLCSIGEEIVARWKTALNRLIQETLE